MKIVCTADLHGVYPQDLPDGDILVIAGDLFERDGGEAFEEWLCHLKHKHILLTPGNHDWDIYDGTFVPEEGNGIGVHYLIDEGIEIGGIKFWGTPWAPPFYDWAYYLEEDQLYEKFIRIPEDTDFLISHCPPLGYGDECYNRNVGSYSLGKVLRERPNIKWTVFGHIHEARSNDPYIEKYAGWAGSKINSLMFNVAYLDERYRPHDLPFLVIDTEEGAA